MATTSVEAKKYFSDASLDSIPQFRDLPPDIRLNVDVATRVLPFKTNAYILNELIDWADIPGDPIFQMNFPQRGMILEEDFQDIRDLIVNEAANSTIESAALRARTRLMPRNPGTTFSLPMLEGKPAYGICHQYRETILAFPAPAQTCFAVCTYCYRWMMHTGSGRYFHYSDPGIPARYIMEHPEISDIQITGGDPMIMSARQLDQIVAPLLKVDSLDSIRFSTRALAFWPFRFTDDPDADAVLRVFERIVASGKHCAIMVHIIHPRELSTPAAQEAIRRIRATGAVIRSQAPVLGHVNDSSETWSALWREQVKLGIVPYYLYADSDSGPREYFKIPISRSFKIFNSAWKNVSGLARTVRGPILYSADSKILVDDIIDINGKKYFLLKYLQCSNSSKTGSSFLKDYDEFALSVEQLSLVHSQ